MQQPTVEQARLKRMLSWRQIETGAPYPETAQPQNNLTLKDVENRKKFSPDEQRTYSFTFEEAQNA